MKASLTAVTKDNIICLVCNIYSYIYIYTRTALLLINPFRAAFSSLGQTTQYVRVMSYGHSSDN